MKVKKVNVSTITSDDLNEYRNKISKLKGNFITSNDVGIDKRIITIRMGGEYEELTLTNPKIVEASDEMVVYFEKDSVKKKTRKTKRYKSIKVETDNLGLVEFAAEKNNWQSKDDFFNDAGLFECVMAQRLIDTIDGIDITHPTRAYSETIILNEKIERNKKIMLQGPNGEMVFIKYKNSKQYIDKGYNFV
jgi:hypothetical protein